VPSQLSFELPHANSTAQTGDNQSPACPVGIAAEVLSGKWTLLIIRELLEGKKRYSQLESALQGISPKMLTARLRLLEAEKLLTRKVYATVPPKTEYRLTGLGRELEKVIASMALFGSLLAESRSG
jgi:DNA-binding HxlR family transcriptional regulator